MDDLITWLRVQLDDDEGGALAASSAPWRPWRGKPGLGLADLDHAVIVGDQTGEAGELARIAAASWLDAEHIARHDPARVLAEVDTKRRILDLHQPERLGDFVDLWCQQCKREEDPCSTLRLLALPYADRPGYRPEWQP